MVATRWPRCHDPRPPSDINFHFLFLSTYFTAIRRRGLTQYERWLFQLHRSTPDSKKSGASPLFSGNGLLCWQHYITIQRRLQIYPACLHAANRSPAPILRRRSEVLIDHYLSSGHRPSPETARGLAARRACLRYPLQYYAFLPFPNWTSRPDDGTIVLSYTSGTEYEGKATNT